MHQLGDRPADPAVLSEQKDDLSVAFLLLLERLSPVERAVFLLRESFDFSYREIAGIVGKSEAACRQIESRARRRLDAEGRPAQADPAEHVRLLLSFLRATREGDVAGLVSLLSHDAVLYSVGGGKTHAARIPIEGSDRIAKFLHGLTSKTMGEIEIRPALVNGRTGALNYLDGHLVSVVSVLIEGGQIQRLFIVVNPDKLPRQALTLGPAAQDDELERSVLGSSPRLLATLETGRQQIREGKGLSHEGF